MARLRGFSSRRVVGASRRKTDWSEGPFSTIQSLAVGNVATQFTSGQQATQPGLTIVRIRGEFAWSIVAAASANDGFDALAIGICVITENQNSVGVTSIPHPLADMEWDGWMYHRLVTGLKALVVDTAEQWGNAGSAQGRVEIDTKAMRKLTETDLVVGVVETGVEVGAATIHFHCRTRMLAKLP